MSETIDPGRLQQIRERAEKATCGTWAIEQEPVACARIGIECEGAPIAEVLNADDFPCLSDDEHDGKIEAVDAQALADADFIIHARQDVPYLLDLLATQDDALRRLMGELDAANQHVKIVNEALEREHEALRRLQQDRDESKAHEIDKEKELARAYGAWNDEQPARIQAEQERDALRESLAAVMEQFDAGAFVRNTYDDGCPDWAIRAVKPLLVLAKAKAALSRPTAATEVKP